MLKSFEFSDIYIGQKDAFLAGSSLGAGLYPVPSEASTDVEVLRERCNQIARSSNKREFAFCHDGITYRAAELTSLSDKVYVLRRFASGVPDFRNLGLPRWITDRLLGEKLTGLIVFSGAFGQGKTTSASALLSARLKEFGGVAITIEDPPEIPLEGGHGDGYCYQTWCEQGDFGQSFRNVARMAPNIIFLGEIRDAEASIEALRASINGRLVICTFHADGVVSTLDRLCSMSASGGSSLDDVSSLMSLGVCAVVHQSLGPSNETPRSIRTEALFIREPGYEGVGRSIRDRRFEILGSDINRLSNQMIMESSRFRRRGELG